jgi:hypothetical protein
VAGSKNKYDYYYPKTPYFTGFKWAIIYNTTKESIHLILSDCAVQRTEIFVALKYTTKHEGAAHANLKTEELIGRCGAPSCSFRDDFLQI